MKKLSKGVRVDVAEGSVMVDVSIIIRMNEKIIEYLRKYRTELKLQLKI